MLLFEALFSALVKLLSVFHACHHLINLTPFIGLLQGCIEGTAYQDKRCGPYAFRKVEAKGSREEKKESKVCFLKRRGEDHLLF